MNPYAAALAVVTSELDNAIRRVQEHEHDLTEITTAEAARGVATALVDCRAEVARLRAIAAAPLVALLHSGDVQPGSWEARPIRALEVDEQLRLAWPPSRAERGGTEHERATAARILATMSSPAQEARAAVDAARAKEARAAENIGSVLRSLEKGDKVTIVFAARSSTSPDDTRTVTVTGVAMLSKLNVYVTSGRTRPGSFSGGIISDWGDGRYLYQPTMQQEVRLVRSLQRVGGASLTNPRKNPAHPEYVLWGLPKGATDALYQKILYTQGKTLADVERVKSAASLDGWHTFRVQTLDLSQPFNAGAAFAGSVRKNAGGSTRRNGSLSAARARLLAAQEAYALLRRHHGGSMIGWAEYKRTVARMSPEAILAEAREDVNHQNPATRPEALEGYLRMLVQNATATIRDYTSGRYPEYAQSQKAALMEELLSIVRVRKEQKGIDPTYATPKVTIPGFRVSLVSGGMTVAELREIRRYIQPIAL